MSTDDDTYYKNSESSGTKGGSLLSDSVRKAVLTGMSALFMTEEGIRNVVSDMRLPKDVLTTMLQQTERSRRELFRAVTDELKGMLRNVDIPGEMRKALTGLKLEVRAEIRFVDAHRSEVSMRAKVKPHSGRSSRRQSDSKAEKKTFAQRSQSSDDDTQE